MRRWIVLLLLLSAAAGVLGQVVWKRLRGVAVTLVPVEEGRVVAAVYATGRVDTDRRATVRARVTAPLVEVLVGPGEEVEAGQIVARQDSAALQLAAERARSELEAARAALAEAMDAAERAEQLVRQQLLPEEAWVRARERARELQAQAAARESALALARQQAGWVELRAPLAGRVSALIHRGGDALREGDDVLTIVDMRAAYVRVAVDERDLGKIQPGQEARLVFDAFPDRLLRGAVWRVVPAVDRLTKSADVLVQLPAERPPLQLDLTATVNIVTGIVERALLVPRDALLGTGAQRQVLLVDGRSRLMERSVTVGVCDERACEVRAGLTAGERVVSPVNPGLAPGIKVQVR